MILTKPRYITPSLREELAKPFGKLASSEKEIVKECDPMMVVSVGDVTTKSLNAYGFGQYISVIDYKVARQKAHTNISDLGFIGDEEILSVTNPAGCLTPELFEVVFSLFTGEKKRRKIVVITGEEDLVVIPVILVAPIGYSVVYGQPREGVVKVIVSNEEKERAHNVLMRMQEK